MGADGPDISFPFLARPRLFERAIFARSPVTTTGGCLGFRLATSASCEGFLVPEPWECWYDQCQIEGASFPTGSGQVPASATWKISANREGRPAWGIRSVS
jgi:hypothetical protein